MPLLIALIIGLGVARAKGAEPAGRERAIDELLSGRFHWTVSRPLLAPAQRPEDPCQSVKDPTIVFHEGRWHLFCTIRSQKRTHQIEYLSFADWAEAGQAPRHILKICDGYFCAPQVFYFTPHQKWYLLFQTSDQTRKPELQPAFSTTRTLGDPTSWSRPTLLFAEHPDTVKAWIDFGIICDDTRAHLFFTSLDGLMWRAETKLADFPGGWSKPGIVLRGDIFEASHTYRLKGLNKFLTLVEAQNSGRRYYKAFLADTLDGEWRPLADTREKPFAGPVNVRDTGLHWTDSFSHGELLRSSCDESLEVDPANLRFLFQGVSDQERSGKKYGEIPWKLGILETAK
ncbi:MAG: hypothetical protein HY674_13040 [Chloroflexi bacterium]|nr:hypothetical protein [Chloroflexota bacterium]